MPRVVVLGTGTDVGKTRVTLALQSALQQRAPQAPLLALKPVETGVDPRRPDLLVPSQGQAPTPSDAAQLAAADGSRPQHYRSYTWGISPHLAASRAAQELRVPEIVKWIEQQEQLYKAHYNTLHRIPISSGLGPGDAQSSASVAPPRPIAPLVTLVETAGGTFTPLSYASTNLALAHALEPASWILVAPDRLGVLHDVTATILAMQHHARPPDHIVLTSPLTNDLSTGTNAQELTQLGLCNLVTTLSTSGKLASDAALIAWLDSLLAPDREAMAEYRTP